MSPDQRAATDDLPVGNLHLGVKARVLEGAGYRTLGDIRGAGLAVIAQVPSIGARTVDELSRNRAALENSVKADGSVDWEAYCAAVGIPIIGLISGTYDGPAFLQGLPNTIDHLAAQLDDDVLAVILRKRICQPPSRQRTLEEIGAAATPPVTRERIRQKERKLLGQIAGGLLNDRYDGLGVHFHPDFTRWWRLAADALADREEIDVSSFVELLAKTWVVSSSAIRAQLPTIVAIVTGEPQLGAGFRFVTKIDLRLFGEIGSDLAAFPVLKLRAGKTALRLWEAGIVDVGGLIELLGSGELQGLGSAAATAAAGHLNLLAGCITGDGRVDWQSYRDSLGLPKLPARPPASPADFTEQLCENIGELLRVHQVTKRAPDILRYRTGQDAGARMTLQHTAERLDTFGSSIKREETEFLAWLNEVLVGGEFWRLDVWLDRDWLTYWAEAKKVFDQATEDYERFADNLAWRWRMIRREIRAAAPVLWAVFTGYPDSRRSTWRPPALAVEDAATVGRIRLRGFRRLH